MITGNSGDNPELADSHMIITNDLVSLRDQITAAILHANSNSD